MKKYWKILFLFVCLTVVSCGRDDSGSILPEPEVPEPEQPEDPEQPVKPEIELTEEGSLTYVMKGYETEATDGGALQPEGFPVAIGIKDKSLQGTSCVFASSAARKLVDMPNYDAMHDWKNTLSIVEGTTCWIRYTTDVEYRYLKLRIDYISGDEVGVEYKVSDVIERLGAEDIEQTLEGSSAFLFTSDVSQLSIQTISSPIIKMDNFLSGENYSFAVCKGVSSLSAMPAWESMSGWDSKAELKDGAVYWVSYTLPTSRTFLRLRIAFVDMDKVGVEYKLDIQEEIQNTNANDPIEGKSFVTDYSMPYLNPENYYVEHTVTYGGKRILNYAYEWVESKKHTAWVAFSFDETTSQKNVSRSDAWATDLELPGGWCPEESNHKSDGFDKGHLCASEDRVYSKEANEQTFFYSNMSPQMSSFNGGFWASFEILVQKWARSGEYDKVYVVKGGTVDQLLVNFTGTRRGNDGVLPQTDANGFTKKGLACPKYYFMAILSEKGGEYHAVGFWMEHRDDYGYEYNNFAPSDVMKGYALSIDDLEKNTGLDFFCNLPDNVENVVESIWKEADWAW